MNSLPEETDVFADGEFDSQISQMYTEYNQ